MDAEALILRYHGFNGGPLSKETLKEFQSKVQFYLESIGQGPYVPILSEINSNVTRALKKLSKDNIDEIEKAEIQPIVIASKQDRKPRTVSQTDIRKIVKEELSGLDAIMETPAQIKKISKVLHEFKNRKLKTPQGKTVTKKNQATAIALREAGVPKRKKPIGKSGLGKSDIGRLRHYIDGYLTIEKEKHKLIKKLELHDDFTNPNDLKTREKIKKQIDEKDYALDIQVVQSAKHLGISESEFIARVNNFTENGNSLKEQAYFEIKKKNGATEKTKLREEPSLGFVAADKTPETPTNTFKLPSVMGDFLGVLQRYKLEIVIAGETHSSKSQLGMQIADGFASLGDEVAWVDWEQGGLNSKDTISNIDRNLSSGNKSKVKVNGNYPRTLSAVKELTKQFKVIALDSGTKLNQVTNAWIDTLREEFPDTVWIIMMQQNEKGGTRGGSAAEFDAPLVIKTYRPDENDYRKNYAKVFKNRGNKTGILYSISDKKILTDDPEVDKVIADTKKKLVIKEAVKQEIGKEQNNIQQPEIKAA